MSAGHREPSEATEAIQRRGSRVLRDLFAPLAMTAANKPTDRILR
jgi:hypothetical protein